MNYPYPIKNWRDESEYNNIVSFAWEFLRRSAAYQQSYDKAESSNERFNLPNYGLMHSDVPPHPIDSFDPEKIRFFLGQEVVVSKFEEKETEAGLIASQLCTAICPVDVVILFQIDDIEALKLQIKKAEAILLAEAEKFGADSPPKQTRVPNKTKLIKYLRALDAKADGADMTEICSILEPNTENTYESGYLARQNINNYIKAGMRFVESGYKDLARSEYHKLRTPLI